jgi:hypothetical protein
MSTFFPLIAYSVQCGKPYMPGGCGEPEISSEYGKSSIRRPPLHYHEFENQSDQMLQEARAWSLFRGSDTLISENLSVFSDKDAVDSRVFWVSLFVWYQGVATPPLSTYK